MSNELYLPNGWTPRPYQRALWAYLHGGGKRAVAAWHRRAGKDDLALHWAACAAHERVGTYWHMLPEASQARKAIWDAVDPHTGRRRIDQAFPRAMRKATRNNEMFLEFLNGSTWQVVGSDNFDSLVGSPPVGIVFSEYALANPGAWAMLRPILAENGGWAIFISTPRGKNHFWSLIEAARSQSSWFHQRLSARDTGVFSGDTLEGELAELVNEHGEDDGKRIYAQEYLVSFEAALVGAYYAREMESADAEQRITTVRVEPQLPVHTAWDLGIGDSTAIWMFQTLGRDVRVVDFIQSSGVGLDWYVRTLVERRHVYGTHYLPHDVEVRELGTGRSRLETLRSLGMAPNSIRVVPQQSIADGINAVRLVLPRTWFDAERCGRGVEALRQYRREWDDKRKVFHDRPLHDWTSHAADAFRYLALGLPTGAQAPAPRRRPARTSWMAA